MAALWRGFLRLSLVSCPVTLAPATTERGRIRLNQLNRATGNRLRTRLVDEVTGEEVERDQIVKGYAVEKGRYVVLDDSELDAIQIESSKIIDLDIFVDAAEIDRLYFDKPYYVAPDGAIGADTFRVVTAAMREKGKIGLGRVVLSNREHLVAVEPRNGVLLMTTLRAANEVRQPEAVAEGGAADEEAVALAATIIERRAGTFDPGSFRDRYQEALRALVEAKAKGGTATPAEVAAPAPVIDLMEALKRSLAAQSGQKAPAPKKKQADTRQRSLLLPVKGGKGAAAPAVAAEAAAAPKKAAPRARRKA
jgi:DNA end-binding protein Ku